MAASSSSSALEPMAPAAGGHGVAAQNAGALDLARVIVAESHDTGVLATGDGTSVLLSNAVIQDTQGRADNGARGRGLNVQDGATAEITRAFFSRNREFGIFVADEGTSLTLLDVVLADTLSQARDGMGGSGLVVQSGATAMASRTLFTENRAIGMLADGEGTSVTLSDAVIAGTLGQESDGMLGRGLSAQFGAAAQLTRVLLSQNREVSLFAGGAQASVLASNLVIEDTLPQESDGRRGRGLSVEAGATGEVSQALISESHEFGVVALGADAAVSLVDVVVTQTDEQSCSATTCADRPFGVGLVGTLGGALVAAHFEVSDAALCGVMVAEEGQVDLSVGRVSGSQTGVCLQVDGYAVPRLTNGVQYVDNGTNLDTTSLPLPAAASAVGD